MFAVISRIKVSQPAESQQQKTTCGELFFFEDRQLFMQHFDINTSSPSKCQHLANSEISVLENVLGFHRVAAAVMDLLEKNLKGYLGGTYRK